MMHHGNAILLTLIPIHLLLGMYLHAQTDTPEETTKGVEAETPAAEPAAATAE